MIGCGPFDYGPLSTLLSEGTLIAAATARLSVVRSLPVDGMVEDYGDATLKLSGRKAAIKSLRGGR